MTEVYRDVFALCSVLLRYPDSEWLDSLDEIESKAKAMPSNVGSPLVEFVKYIRSHDVHDLQENYVRTFDFNDMNCLHLTYLGFGTRPERGEQLFKLKSLYASAGMSLETSELPDYLPVLLEFLSSATKELAKNALVQQASSIASLSKNLEKEGSPYKHVLKGCVKAAEKLGVKSR